VRHRAPSTTELANELPTISLSRPTQRRPTPVATTVGVTFRVAVHEDLMEMGLIL
jgi:hypothetical protein